MVKKSNKKPKSSVKMQNKQMNKAKRQKSKSSKLRKNLKLSQKANNKHLNQQQRDLEELDSEGQTEFENTNALSSSKRKLIENDSIESNYKVKNYIKTETTEKQRVKMFALPIKTSSGLVMKNSRPIEDQSEDEEPESKKQILDKNEPTPVIELEEPKTFIELLREKKVQLEKNKEKIAIFSRDVLQNPQDEMKKLKELRQMLTYPDVRNSLILRKLIVVSLCEIYKDIMPSYKIRPLTEKEKEQNVGKEVQQLREYEETLVKQYKLYIDYLNDSIKIVNKSLLNMNDETSPEFKSLKQFVVICVKCLTSLIEKLSYFNHANDLIELVVSQLTNKISEISRLALESVKKLFKEDKELQLSLDITQKITKMLKQKSYGVRPEILDVFLSLKLKEIQVIEDEKEKQLSHKEKMKLSRSDRKKLKEQKQLEQDLEEKKLPEKLKAKAKLQSRILEQIFMVYFNILKKTPNFKLIPCVLEGLAKFAHLINLDFFDDLIKLMHQMIESEKLAFRSKLHCIKTIFVVLSGQGESLTIDPLRFYTSLYNILLKIDVTGSIENTNLLAECIEMMFFRRKKQIPTARLMAFIKRLSIISLQSDPISSNIILLILRKLINIKKSSDLLFDNEYQDSGIYNPELPEPDYANAQNSAVWELHLLRKSYNKFVAIEASNLLKDQSISIDDNKKTPQNLIDFMTYEDNKIFEK